MRKAIFLRCWRRCHAWPRMRGLSLFSSKPVRVITGFPPGSGMDIAARAIVLRLNAEIVKMLGLPEVRSRFAAQGIEVLGGASGQFAAAIREEIAKWAKVIRCSGTRAQCGKQGARRLARRGREGLAPGEHELIHT